MSLAIKSSLAAALLLSVPAPLAAQREGPKGLIQIPYVNSEMYKAPPLSPEALREAEENLRRARAQYEKNPGDADALIWLGRRTAYLGRFDEAIRIYSEGVEKHPRDARLYRHRGHRYITVRRLDLAIKDLERAARLISGKPDEVEPDGLPNARGVPTSTLQSNVWYHLGLAYYLAGDFEKALRAYRKCLKCSKSADTLAATSHWLYMTLRRLKRDDEARRVLDEITEGMDIVESHDYHRLLLMYKGALTPEKLLEDASKNKSSLGFASTAYGVGNWYAYTGQPGKALNVFLEIVTRPQRTSFGYIAAEAELERMGVRGYPRELPRKTLYD